jgi:hypothetical protein
MTPCIRKTGKIKAVHGLIQSWPETKVIVPQAVYLEAVIGDKPQARELQEYLQGRVRRVDPSYPIQEG